MALSCKPGYVLFKDSECLPECPAGYRTITVKSSNNDDFYYCTTDLELTSCSDDPVNVYVARPS